MLIGQLVGNIISTEFYIYLIENCLFMHTHSIMFTLFTQHNGSQKEKKGGQPSILIMWEATNLRLSRKWSYFLFTLWMEAHFSLFHWLHSQVCNLFLPFFRVFYIYLLCISILAHIGPQMSPSLFRLSWAFVRLIIHAVVPKVTTIPNGFQLW